MPTFSKYRATSPGRTVSKTHISDAINKILASKLVDIEIRIDKPFWWPKEAPKKPAKKKDEDC